MTRPTRDQWLFLACCAGSVATAIGAYFAVGHLWRGVYWSAPFAVWVTLVSTFWAWRGGYKQGYSDGSNGAIRFYHERMDPKLEGFGEGYKAAQETHKLMDRYR